MEVVVDCELVVYCGLIGGEEFDEFCCGILVFVCFED